MGTESSRACIIDSEGSLLHAEKTSQAMASPRKGWAEQEPLTWWDNTRKNIKSLLRHPEVSPDGIKAIGVCGQMHAPVPIDDRGEPINQPVSLWCDKRADDVSRELIKREPEENFFLSRAGNPPLPAWMGIKIAWLKRNHPDIYEKASYFLPPKDYINYELTGEMATDYSEASGSFLMDKESGEWSKELIELLNLDRGKIPEIAKADEVLAPIKGEIASNLGLSRNTPVIVGGGDMLCLLLGAGIVEPRLACDTTGTASVFSAYSENPASMENIMSLRHVVDGWINFGILDSGGGSLWWFKDLLEGVLPASGELDYELLSEAAARSRPGANGLFFLPYLQGERVMGSSRSSGVFYGLTPAHSYEDMARAIMEGVTFDLNRTGVILDEKEKIEEMRTIGGGAKSETWNKIKANIYGKSLATLRSFEGGVVGCSFLAHSALGWIDNPVVGVEKLELENKFEPRGSAKEEYGDYFEKFCCLHDEMQPLFEEI